MALFWISFSLRPMTLSELCEAIIIPEDNETISQDMRLLQPRTLLQSLSSLISYNAKTSEINLAHSSVLDYLTSDDLHRSDSSVFFLNEKTAEMELATACLNYLLHPAFDSGYCSSCNEFTDRLQQWPLLPYICDTLFEHLSYISLTEPFIGLLMRFFGTRSTGLRGGNFGAWVAAWGARVGWGLEIEDIESSTPLYFAARHGLLPIVKMILQVEGTKHLEQPGGTYGSTPLHVAAWAGQTAVVAELLAAGANPRERNATDDTGLYWAARLGFKDIVAMLRDAGAVL